MEKFSLDKWLKDKSRKVETRDGREVDIYYSPTSRIPLIGRTSDNEVHQYTEDGFQYEMINQAKNDLFFADEKEELTELQKTLEEDCDCYVNLYNDGKTREELREWIKGWCPRIIDLARKELRKEQQEKLGTLEMPIDVTEPYYIKGKQDAGEAKVKELVAEFEKGRQDALKDLPRYKKAKESRVLDWVVKITEDGNIIFSDVVYKGEYFIMLQSLKALPKEE